MSKQSRSGEAAARAAEVLEPEGGLVALIDPVSFCRSLAVAAGAAARHPSALFKVASRFVRDAPGAGIAVTERALGNNSPGPVAPKPKDRRFKDPAWEENPALFATLQLYLLWARAVVELMDEVSLAPPVAQKSRFAAQMIIDALAPTNLLWTNPEALKRALETGGLSLLRGVRNFIDDLMFNGGFPRQVDTSGFELGRNLAATPGKVVFRNDLMELIQYAPRTETVFETPILCSPPWINKYYIMDLSPSRSFIEWAVHQGHTVFAISYRNPDESMRDVRLDDYLLSGPRTALDVIQDITETEQVNVVGLCVGGTLTVMLLAYLAAIGEARVRSATLLNTMIDFGQPGALGSFTDAESVSSLEPKMARRGYLEASDMKRTFDVLRANDLIWNYVVSNWLMGENPPAFDILAWNSDGTRMPATLHSFYLRSCYVENRLARGELELAGTHLALDDITEDVYVLAAKEDHIVPWRSSYRTTQLLKGRVRFVLSASGHIAGIINPPGSKARHWVNFDLLDDADEWLGRASERDGSWWEDWVDWIAERAGDLRTPPPLGSGRYPALADAPGTYISH